MRSKLLSLFLILILLFSPPTLSDAESIQKATYQTQITYDNSFAQSFRFSVFRYLLLGIVSLTSLPLPAQFDATFELPRPNDQIMTELMRQMKSFLGLSENLPIIDRRVSLPYYDIQNLTDYDVIWRFVDYYQRADPFLSENYPEAIWLMNENPFLLEVLQYSLFQLELSGGRSALSRQEADHYLDIMNNEFTSRGGHNLAYYHAVQLRSVIAEQMVFSGNYSSIEAPLIKDNGDILGNLDRLFQSIDTLKTQQDVIYERDIIPHMMPFYVSLLNYYGAEFGMTAYGHHVSVINEPIGVSPAYFPMKYFLSMQSSEIDPENTIVIDLHLDDKANFGEFGYPCILHDPMRGTFNNTRYFFLQMPQTAIIESDIVPNMVQEGYKPFFYAKSVSKIRGILDYLNEVYPDKKTILITVSHGGNTWDEEDNPLSGHERKSVDPRTGTNVSMGTFYDRNEPYPLYPDHFFQRADTLRLDEWPEEELKLKYVFGINEILRDSVRHEFSQEEENLLYDAGIFDPDLSDSTKWVWSRDILQNGYGELFRRFSQSPDFSRRWKDLMDNPQAIPNKWHNIPWKVYYYYSRTVLQVPRYEDILMLHLYYKEEGFFENQREPLENYLRSIDPFLLDPQIEQLFERWRPQSIPDPIPPLDLQPIDSEGSHGSIIRST